MRRDDMIGRVPTLRPRWSKESSRESLRIRIPQVDIPVPEEEDEPSSPDSSGESADESDSDDESDESDDEEEEDEDGEEVEEDEEEEEDEDEDEEEDEEDEEEEEEADDEADDEEEDGEEDEEDGETPDGSTDDSDGPSATLTNAPAPSGGLPAPDGVVDSELPSTTFLTRPSDTSLPSGTESIDSVAASTTDAGATATADSEVDFVNDRPSGTSNRAADVGIIIGTLALAVLLVVGGVFLYRWNLRRKARSLADGSAGGRPSSADSGHAGLVAAAQMEEQSGNRGLQEDGSWAFFNTNAPAQQPTSSSDVNNDPRDVAMAALTGMAITSSAPSPPTAAYQPYGRQTDDNGVSPPDSPVFMPSAGGAAVPQQNVPEVQVTRASTATGQPMGMPYPPGTFRFSVARTETTDATEGTWRTWNVDQKQATHGKGWKERYLS